MNEPTQPNTLEYATAGTGGMGYATFQPNAGRAKVAIILLWIYVGVQVLSLVGSIVAAALLLTGQTTAFERWLDLDQGNAFWIFIAIAGAFGLLVMVHWVVMIVTYMMWQYRASANLGPLGVRGQRYVPGWTVGWWFIPIANLFMPYRCMREIEHASRTGMGMNATECSSDLADKTQILILLVIVLGIIAGAVEIATTNGGSLAPTPTSQAVSVVSDIVLGALNVAYVYLFIPYIKRIQKLQEQR